VPQWGLRGGERGGRFLHRRSPPLVQASDSGHTHQTDVPDRKWASAWRSRDVESYLVDSPAIPLRGTCLRRSAPAGGRYWVLLETRNSPSGADQSNTLYKRR